MTDSSLPLFNVASRASLSPWLSRHIGMCFFSVCLEFPHIHPWAHSAFEQRVLLAAAALLHLRMLGEGAAHAILRHTTQRAKVGILRDRAVPRQQTIIVSCPAFPRLLTK